MKRGENNNGESYIDSNGKKWALLGSQWAVIKTMRKSMSMYDVNKYGNLTYGPQWK